MLPRDRIVAILMDKVNSKQVSITLGRITIMPSISKPSLVEKSDGLTSGQAVGLTVGVLVIGVTVGIVSSFLIMWIVHRRKTDKYKELN